MKYPRHLQWFTFIKGLLKTLDSSSDTVVIVFADVYISSYLHVEEKNLKTIHVKIQYSCR